MSNVLWNLKLIRADKNAREVLVCLFGCTTCELHV